MAKGEGMIMLRVLRKRQTQSLDMLAGLSLITTSRTCHGHSMGLCLGLRMRISSITAEAKWGSAAFV